MTDEPAVAAFLTHLDVAALSAWIEAIPFSDWPPGNDPTRLRPAMVTDPKWNGLYDRTSALVALLLSALGNKFDIGQLAATNRWLSVVMPGQTIDPHADAAEPGWVCKVHVPLATNPGAVMIADGEAFHMEVGAAYLFDKTSRHAVANAGKTPRVHFMFEVLRAE